MENTPTFAILGIHGPDVQTVEGNVARVRMFIDDKVYDENFAIPVVKTLEELLSEQIEKRVEELKAGVTSTQASKIVPDDADQLITDNPDIALTEVK